MRANAYAASVASTTVTIVAAPHSITMFQAERLIWEAISLSPSRAR